MIITIIVDIRRSRKTQRFRISFTIEGCQVLEFYF